MPRNKSIKGDITCYVKPRYYKMVVAFSYNNCISKSQALFDLIKKNFDALPIETQGRLLRDYDKLTAREKKFPGGFSPDVEEETDK